MDVPVAFAKWCQCTSPPNTYFLLFTCGDLDPSTTCFLGLTWVHIPNSTSISSVIVAQLTAECHYTLQWAAPFPLKIAPAHGICTPSNTCFLGPTRVHNPNGIWIGSAVFTQFMVECLYTLQWAALSPLKIVPSQWDLDLHLIHDSLGPLKSSTQMASRSVQLFLQAHYCDRRTDRQTDWQADHATQFVRIGRIYVHSTAMLSNNCRCSLIITN